MGLPILHRYNNEKIFHCYMYELAQTWTPAEIFSRAKTFHLIATFVRRLIIYIIFHL